MNIVKDGNDYEQQQVSTWRLRELLQHEKDNRELRQQLSAQSAQLAAQIALFQTLREKIESMQGLPLEWLSGQYPAEYQRGYNKAVVK